MNDKYKDACSEYAKASADVRRLSKVIGDALSACHSAQEPVLQEVDGVEVLDSVDHLKMAYAMDKEPADSGYGYQLYFANHDGDVGGYLQGRCSHCYAAHMAIQERKESRRRLGVAKRRICILGRAVE